MKKNEDDRQHELLEAFANGQSVTKGGNIKVTVDRFSTHLQPKEGYSGFKIEDCIFLNELMMGANNFMYWLRREGYKIIKPKVKKCE